MIENGNFRTIKAGPDNRNKVRKIGEALNTYRVYKADGFFESDEAAQAWMDKYYCSWRRILRIDTSNGTYWN